MGRGMDGEWIHGIGITSVTRCSSPRWPSLRRQRRPAMAAASSRLSALSRPVVSPRDACCRTNAGRHGGARTSSRLVQQGAPRRLPRGGCLRGRRDPLCRCALLALSDQALWSRARPFRHSILAGPMKSGCWETEIRLAREATEQIPRRVLDETLVHPIDHPTLAVRRSVDETELEIEEGPASGTLDQQAPPD